MYGHEWYLFSDCLRLYPNVGIQILWGIYSGESIDVRPISVDAGDES